MYWIICIMCVFILFSFVWFVVPLENFSLIWRHHHCHRRAANFDLCSTLMANEQWWFFSVPHRLWRGASVYNGHLLGPVTLTPFAVELLLPLFSTKVCRGWDSNTQPSACEANALTNCVTEVFRMRQRVVAGVMALCYLQGRKFVFLAPTAVSSCYPFPLPDTYI